MTAITADIPYTLDTGEKLINETFGPNNIHRRHIGTMDPRPMKVENGRPLAAQLSLDKNGFVFVEHPTAVADFFDQANLTAAYYPEVEQLICKLSGASRVVVFDHTLRSGAEAEREEKLIREPILSAHNDYTEWSAPQRVRDLLPAEADRLLAGRFAIIQVWRAINQPIEANPLAIADAQSVESATCSSRNAATQTASGKPTGCATTRATAGFIFRACAATRRSCSKCSTRQPTVARALPRTLRSRTLRLRPPRGRARA